MPPALSILIPSVPERAAKLATLLAALAPQIKAASGQAEVLVLTDLRTMSLGEKRNRLLQIAAGDFVINLDDDDRLTDDALATLLPIIAALDPEVDVIAYDQACHLNGEPPFRVRTSLEFENETAAKDADGVWKDIRRKPWHWCAFRTELARRAPFIGRIDEDWQWLRQTLPQVRRQYKLDRVLHEYHFNQAESLCLEQEEPS